MPAYSLTVPVEIIIEGTGAYTNFEFDHQFYAEDDDDAQEYVDAFVDNDIFEYIMNDVSIVPQSSEVEWEREDD